MVGAAAARTAPANPVGWILLASGVLLPVATGAYLYAQAAFAPGSRLPGVGLAGWLDGWPWVPAVAVVPTVGLLLFPTGRPPSARWRPALWAGYLVLAALTASTLFGPGLLDFPDGRNPTALGQHLQDLLRRTAVATFGEARGHRQPVRWHCSARWRMFLAAGRRRLVERPETGQDLAKGTENMMSRVSLAIGCEALFVSNVQSSEHLQPPQIRMAITETIRKLGVHECAAIVAQEFGDHPETAVHRMRWAREAVSRAYSDTVRTHMLRFAPVPTAR